jgi:hypothetical protein
MGVKFKKGDIVLFDNRRGDRTAGIVQRIENSHIFALWLDDGDVSWAGSHELTKLGEMDVQIQDHDNQARV